MKNSLFQHGTGILMPISALPGRYGIGSLGREAFRFVDFLCESGQSHWQVLPIHPTAYGDSPYQTPSSMAGNPYFIDLDLLGKEGLLTKEELEEERCKITRIDYGRLFSTRFCKLKLAYKRFQVGKEYKLFLRKNEKWLLPYALFMSLKERYHFAPWTTWSVSHRVYASALLYKEEFAPEMAFWNFTQYCFFKQWEALHEYARKKGISLIGDMPIYVAHDSVEVWSRPDLFQLDEEGNALAVAGCPPDAFSEEGQLWGNPLYRWDVMEADGFSWWCERVAHALSLYDHLRLDHFRGFAEYYAIPYGAKDARDGSWHSAPGFSLFRKIKERFPKAKMIAEDLGHITPDVRELLAYTAFPGMKVLQFAFDTDESEYLPRNFETENCVVYTASHDSSCSASFLNGLTHEAKRRFLRECPHRKGQNRVYDLIEFALRSPATLSIIPMQDYLCLPDAVGRMNTPSTSQGNWTFRLSPRYNTAVLREKILGMAKRCKRAR